MHTLPHLVPPNLQQATADPCLRWRLLDTNSQASLDEPLVGSLLLSPGSWCAQGFICSLRESVFPVCVSSGGSMVGLKATSSKRAYATTRHASPRAPAPVAGHCWPGPLQVWLSLYVVSGSWCTQGFVWVLWVSLADMGFVSKCDFTPPTILLVLLLCPRMWGIFIQQWVVIWCSHRRRWAHVLSFHHLVNIVSPLNPWNTFRSDILRKFP